MIAELDEVRRKRDLADHYYDNYGQSHKSGELSKASEFLWGMISNLTYCLGLLEGKKLGTHKKVIQELITLASVSGDQDMVEQIDSCEILHANFYNDFLSQEYFERHRLKVETLARKLASILDQKLHDIERAQPLEP